MNDAELIARARAGDTAAFGQLVARHQHLVVAVALAVTGDRARAEDAAQEAFVAAWRGLGSLKEEARVGSWIAGIARHRALDLVRGKAARQAAHPPSEGGSYHEPPTTDPSPLDHLLDAEEHELVAGALAALPDTQRETVILHYFEGQSVRAVATALAVTEDTVKQRLHRARETLRDRVADRLGSALTNARPSAAFATGVLAAIGTITAASTASAATAAVTQGALMTTKQLVVGLGALVLASGATFVALRKPPVSAAAPLSASAPEPKPVPEPDPALLPPNPMPPHRARKVDPAARERLATAIRAARARRTASTPPTASSPASRGGLSGDTLLGDADADKEVIRANVRELIPLVSECYEQALERRPTLAGTLVVKFTIEGEPDVGGIIGSSEIDKDESSLDDAEVHECVRETMFALELPPPTGGGVVNVTYPFEFRTADEADLTGLPTPPPAP